MQRHQRCNRGGGGSPRGREARAQHVEQDEDGAREPQQRQVRAAGRYRNYGALTRS